MTDDDNRLLQKYLSDVRAIPHADRRTIEELLTRTRDGEVDAEERLLEALLEATAVLARHLAPPTMRQLDSIQEANLVLMQLVRDRRVEAPVLALPEALAQRFRELEGGA